MFWRPHGKRINYLTVEDGQPVEGYIKYPGNPFRHAVKDGRIRIEKLPSGRKEIFIDGIGFYEKRIGTIWMDENFVRFDRDYGLTLYDGTRFTNRKSGRIDILHRIFG